ncbi:MAG: PilN domain-containing protein [Patescibacteria group bacterium]|nr:PilN domain-containing protein [Patescibacteria group bacterium]
MSINLLPPKESAEISLEKSRKKIFLAFCFLLIILALLAVILAGLNAFLAQKGEVVRANGLKDQQLIGGGEFESSKDIISGINRNLAWIDEVRRNKVPADLFLQKLSASVPPQIVLSSISFRKDLVEADGKNAFFATVSLTGTATTREALYNFGQSLAAEKSFWDIRFSPSSWVKPVRASFYLEMKFQPQ